MSVYVVSVVVLCCGEMPRAAGSDMLPVYACASICAHTWGLCSLGLDMVVMFILQSCMNFRCSSAGQCVFLERMGIVERSNQSCWGCRSVAR